MPDYKPLTLYRARPIAASFPITGRFGQTDEAWTPTKPHLGVDFGCPTGTPVYATCYGRTTSLAAHDGSFGQYVLVDCTTKDGEATEWYMLHAHLSVVRLGEEAKVKPGDLLGYSGASGFVTGPHLHWQMCRNMREFPRDIRVMADPFSFPVEHMPDPSLPTVESMTQQEFFSAVCRGLGLQPTPWRLAVFEEWARMESTGQLFAQARNPLATTWYIEGETKLDTTFDIGFGPGNWNNLGNGISVRVYRGYTDGIDATVRTLQLSHYVDIRRALADQAPYPETLDDFQTWIGSAGYAAHMVAFMLTLQAPKGDTPAPAWEPTGAEINQALQWRFALTRLANDSDILKVEAAYNILRTEALL